MARAGDARDAGRREVRTSPTTRRALEARDDDDAREATLARAGIVARVVDDMRERVDARCRRRVRSCAARRRQRRREDARDAERTAVNARGGCDNYTKNRLIADLNIFLLFFFFVVVVVFVLRIEVIFGVDAERDEFAVL
jgi:hypothetical protein